MSIFLIVSCLAFEPVQSLLAVGTSESKYGPGKIYVFGRGRIYKVLHATAPNIHQATTVRSKSAR